MKIFIQSVVIFIVIFLVYGCSHVTYTPHSKKSAQREKPSVVLLNAIIDFRTEQLRWPYSKEDLTRAGKKYLDVFDGFPYLYTQFKVTDDNKMVFYFSQHTKDIKNYNATQMVDLNSYSGSVKFYKKDDRFIWKIKMN